MQQPTAQRDCHDHEQDPEHDAEGEDCGDTRRNGEQDREESRERAAHLLHGSSNPRRCPHRCRTWGSARVPVPLARAVSYRCLTLRLKLGKSGCWTCIDSVRSGLGTRRMVAKPRFRADPGFPRISTLLHRARVAEAAAQTTSRRPTVASQEGDSPPMRSPSLFLASALALTFMVPAQTPGSGSATETPPSAANPAEAGKPRGAAPEPKAEPKDEPKPTLKQMFAKSPPDRGHREDRYDGRSEVAGGLAVPGGEDGRRFLRELGNRPGPATLGVAIPPDFEDSDVFAVYSYSDEGHVDDSETPDYSQLVDMRIRSRRRRAKSARRRASARSSCSGGPNRLIMTRRSTSCSGPRSSSSAMGRGSRLLYNVRVLGRAGHLVAQRA